MTTSRFMAVFALATAMTVPSVAQKTATTNIETSGGKSRSTKTRYLPRT